jgi:dipeptidyl aminopeptidase/acylaminoacyl peptidase
MATLHKTAKLSAAALSVGLAFFAAASWGQSLRPMTPEDVARIQEVEDAVVSPDGGAVAYRLRVPRVPFEDPDGEALVELWVIEGDEPPRPFVTGDVEVDEIAWTPDGGGISFLAEREDDENAALFVIPRDGGEARRILTHPSGIDAYSWSPDGTRVAFLAKEEESDEAKELEEAGFDAEVFEEDWRWTRLWVASVDPAEAGPEGSEDGGEGPRDLGLAGEVDSVQWCPAGPGADGGDRLAVTVASDPSVDSGYMFTRIRIVDADSGEVVTRVDNPGKLDDVEWAPDCSHLSFISGRDIHDPAEGRLMIASGSDGTFEDILPDFPGHVLDIEWVDGDRLLFLGDEGVESRVYRIGRDGSGRTRLLDAGEEVWDSVEAAADSDGGLRLALVGESARHPAELFTADLAPAAPPGTEKGSLAPERRTDSNPWLAGIAFAEQETVTYEARDGLELQGLLIRPLERVDGERHPLILKVHGGPESHYRDGWLTSYSLPGQVAAGEGYAVFYPNYRGSTGRGVELSLLSQGKPAGAEFDDLVDAVDHLAATGLADPERVGITGGSYGGYASAWGATYYTERFAAAVMFVGISDKVSKLGTSDIPEELYLVHERKRLWEDWEHFLKASPIYYVERAETPILILGGTADTRVDPGQSLELFRHLKTLGNAPVRLVRYPDEPHGNRRAASRYDYNLRMMRWFDHYLKGDGGEPPPWRVDYPLREAAADEE